MSFTASLSDIVAENRNGLLGDGDGQWARVPLGDLASVQNGFPFPSARFSKTSGVPLIRIRDILGTSTEVSFDGEHDPAFLVEPGDLLVGMDGDFNAALWRGPRGLLNQRVCRLRPHRDRLDLRFLAYILPGYLNAINEATSSITVKHLSSRTVASIPIPLPPLREQHAIVATLEERLSDLDSAVASLIRASANLRRYREAAITSGVTGQLLRPVEDLSRGGWPVRLLRELGAIKGGITKGQKRRAGDPVRTVPYLRVANVQRGFLDLKDVRTIEATEAEIKELRLEPGDVLFNEGGDRDKLGRGWVWCGEIPECIHQNHVFRARLDADVADHRFVSYYANSVGRQYFLEQGKQTTNLASINLTKLGGLPVPLPPVEEQRRIVDEIERRLHSSERVIRDVERQLARAAGLRRALLRDAFAGKLVPSIADTGSGPMPAVAEASESVPVIRPRIRRAARA